MKIIARYCVVILVTVFVCLIYIFSDVELNGFSQVLQNLRPTAIRSQFLQNITDFFYYIENPKMKCHKKRKFGGDVFTSENYCAVLDGDYDVCLDPFFNITPGHCIVYSFGINNMWGFDEAMSGFGCQVFAFDPTMNQTNFKHSERIDFYNLGVGATDGTVKCEQVDKSVVECQVRRLSTITAMLGHSRPDFHLDYMKMDVEGAEVDFLQEALVNSKDILKRVKQIGLEIHPGLYKGDMKPFQSYYTILKELEAIGFRIFHSQGNPYDDFDSTRVPGYRIKGFYTLFLGRMTIDGH